MINKTIHKDMESFSKSLAQKESELRKERLRLIKERMGQELGPDAISDQGKIHNHLHHFNIILIYVNL